MAIVVIVVVIIITIVITIIKVNSTIIIIYCNCKFDYICNYRSVFEVVYVKRLELQICV